MSPPAPKSAPPIPGAPDDASIPLLTERLTLPPLELDTTLPRDSSEEPLSLPDPIPEPAALAPRVTAAPTVPDRKLSFDLELPDFAAVAPPPPVPPPPPPPPPPAPPPPLAAPKPTAEGPATGANWTRIEMELRTSILNELAQSLPQEVDAIVRARMGEAIDRLVQQLAVETRVAVAASLREIVEHAVRAELERLRNRKR